MMQSPANAVAAVSGNTTPVPLVLGQPTPSGREFKERDTVLAYHGALLYEGVVQRVKKHEGRIVGYVLQYVGWMKSWNAQVDPSAVFEHNDTNLRIAHLLVQNAKLRSEAQTVGPAPVAVSPIRPPSPYPLPAGHAHYPPHDRQQVDVEDKVGSGLAPLPSTALGASPAAVHLRVTPLRDEQYPGMLERPPSDRLDLRQPPRTPGRPPSDPSQPHPPQLQPTPTPTATATHDPPASSVSHTPSPTTAQLTPRRAYEPIEDADAVMQQHNAHVDLFTLPTALRQQLVDDWELVTKEGRLVPLPRAQSVEHILASWQESREGGDRDDYAAAQEVADGIRHYFNATLPTLLLYRFERPQHAAYFADDDIDPRPSAHYGAEHLCRLLLKLPYILTDNAEATGMSPTILRKIAEKSNQLARFINDNGRLLLLPAYDAPPPGYAQRVPQPIPTPVHTGMHHLSDSDIRFFPATNSTGDRERHHMSDSGIFPATNSTGDREMFPATNSTGDREHTPREHTSARVPDVDSDATPRRSTPRASTPRRSTPRGATPRGATPRGATPRGTSPRSMSLLQSESDIGSSAHGESTHHHLPSPNGRSPHSSQRQHDTD